MKVEIMKIDKFKKLENIVEEIKGQHILLMGDNGVGKTSVIQFLEIALGKQTNLPPNAEGSGEIVINKDGNLITFKVVFKDGKPVIKVSGKGISIDNNKSAIAQLVGAPSLDVEHFVNLSKTKAGRKEQVDEWKKRLPEDVRIDLAKHEANVANAYSERTEINKDITKLEGAVKLNPLYNHVHELDKFTETKTENVLAELKAVNEHNDKVIKRREGVETRKGEIQVMVDKKIALLDEIQRLDDAMLIVGAQVKEVENWLKDNTIKPTEVLEKSLSDASDNNVKFNHAQTLKKDIAKIAELKEQSGEATALIESTKEAISEAVKSFEGPIADLGYDDDQLIYKGIPVHPDSLSKSEIMELGIRLKISDNPDGILFIQEAESLGAERFMLLKDLADKNGLQIIAEQVQRGQKELSIEIMTNELITA